MIELLFADTARLKSSGRCFTCSECPDAIKTLRRCEEDRWDFTEEDASFWPIQITPEGGFFSFCPGKATWDMEVANIFRMLVITAETGQLLEKGAILDQQRWYIELLSWFLPRYNDLRFYSRARAILGDGKK